MENNKILKDVDQNTIDRVITAIDAICDNECLSSTELLEITKHYYHLVKD